MADIGWAVATALLHIVLVSALAAPLIWLRARRGGYTALRSGGARSLALAAGVYLGAHVVLLLPRVGVFADLTYNWQNKLLLLALLVLSIRQLSTVSWHEVGLRRPQPGWWVAPVGAFVAMLGLNLLGGPQFETGAETVLFQAVVPGLDEELLFRGLLLVLLQRALTGRRAMWRSQVGWEVPITSVLFGLVHGLHVTHGWQIDLQVAPLLSTGVLGVLLAWVRIRWASLLPAVLTHNAINTSGSIANALLGR